jgi:uncharacterized protein YktB (UPF0637 family)
MPIFTAADFKVFQADGFQARMTGIRTRIRPKLEALGTALAPAIRHATCEDVFAHVARHARRTVTPPGDTWVAFAPDLRGYKKHNHFKVAVSRRGVRFLFEVGPEHADKRRFAGAWRKSAPRLGAVLRRVNGLAWFKDEHDDEPAAALADLSPESFTDLAAELTRTRDGQLVLGRALAATAVTRMTSSECREQAVTTFRALAPLYRLR